MRNRCTNFNYSGYKDYGGRGITVCERWMKFENFLEDMGEPPTKGHTLDRKNNDRGYCKSNCRWATKKQQMRNKRNNRLLTYKGKTQCMTDWASQYGMNKNTLRSRIVEMNWSIEKALTSPVRKRKKRSK